MLHALAAIAGSWICRSEFSAVALPELLLSPQVQPLGAHLMLASMHRIVAFLPRSLLLHVFFVLERLSSRVAHCKTAAKKKKTKEELCRRVPVRFAHFSHRRNDALNRRSVCTLNGSSPVRCPTPLCAATACLTRCAHSRERADARSVRELGCDRCVNMLPRGGAQCAVRSVIRWAPAKAHCGDTLAAPILAQSRGIAEQSSFEKGRHCRPWLEQNAVGITFRGKPSCSRQEMIKKPNTLQATKSFHAKRSGGGGKAQNMFGDFGNTTMPDQNQSKCECVTSFCHDERTKSRRALPILVFFASPRRSVAASAMCSSPRQSASKARPTNVYETLNATVSRTDQLRRFLSLALFSLCLSLPSPPAFVLSSRPLLTLFLPAALYGDCFSSLGQAPRCTEPCELVGAFALSVSTQQQRATAAVSNSSSDSTFLLSSPFPPPLFFLLFLSFHSFFLSPLCFDEISHEFLVTQ